MITINMHDPVEAELKEHATFNKPFCAITITSKDRGRVTLFLDAMRFAEAEAAVEALNAAIGVKE